jgi:hypothetical protein
MYATPLPGALTNAVVPSDDSATLKPNCSLEPNGPGAGLPPLLSVAVGVELEDHELPELV